MRTDSADVTPETVQRLENRRVLAVGAHPDDVEFMAGGTLGRLRALGFEIVIATMTPGDCGSAELSAQEIAAVRRKEAEASAALLQGRFLCLEERDLCIDDKTATRRKVTALVRHVDPLVVLTHPREDYMVDHEVTSRLVRDACFAASLPNFESASDDPPTLSIPFLFYWDPFGIRDFRGHPVDCEFAVNIGETMELKRQLLACHQSQREWLRRQHRMDHYLQFMEECASDRGAEFGCAYSEGFVQHRGHPYPHDNVLQAVLGECGVSKTQ